MPSWDSVIRDLINRDLVINGALFFEKLVCLKLERFIIAKSSLISIELNK
jgi:hypothetical protein